LETIEDYRTKYEVLSDLAASFEYKIQGLISEKCACESEIESQTNRIIQYCNEIDILKKNIAEYANQETLHLQNIHSLEDKVTDQEQRNAIICNNLQKMISEKEASDNKFNQMSVKCDQYEDEIKRLLCKCEKMEESILDGEGMKNEQINDEELSDLLKLNSELTTAIGEQQISIDNLNQEMENCRSMLIQKEKEYFSAREELNLQVSLLSDRLDEERINFVDLQANNQDLKQKNEFLDQMTSSLQNQVEECNAERKILESSVVDLNSTITRQLLLIEDLQTDCSKFEEILADKERDNSKRLALDSDSVAKCSILEEELKKYKLQSQDLAEQLVKLQQTFTELEQNHNSCQKELFTQKNDLDEAITKYEQLKCEMDLNEKRSDDREILYSNSLETIKKLEVEAGAADRLRLSLKEKDDCISRLKDGSL
jgi:chromosome segregation ATPase